MLKYVWLSYSLSEKTPAYGGGQGLRVEPVKSIAKGDSCNTAIWHLPNHIGTHVDAPKHFYETGKGIDAYKPGFWLFDQVCVVTVHLEAIPMMICPEHVIPFIKGEPDMILIKTGMGRFRGQSTYWEANPGLNPGLGRILRDCYPSLRAVGVDFISISSWGDRIAGREAHREFLNPAYSGAQIVLIEDMDLSPLINNIRVNKVIALPLRVENGDGAPCSVIAEVEIDD